MDKQIKRAAQSNTDRSPTKEELHQGVAFELLGQINQWQKESKHSVGKLPSALDMLTSSGQMGRVSRAGYVLGLGLVQGVPTELESQWQNNRFGLFNKAGINLLVGGGLSILSKKNPLLAMTIGLSAGGLFVSNELFDADKQRRNKDVAKLVSAAYHAKSNTLLPYYANRITEKTQKDVFDFALASVTMPIGFKAGQYAYDRYAVKGVSGLAPKALTEGTAGIQSEVSPKASAEVAEVVKLPDAPLVEQSSKTGLDLQVKQESARNIPNTQARVEPSQEIPKPLDLDSMLLELKKSIAVESPKAKPLEKLPSESRSAPASDINVSEEAWLKAIELEDKVKVGESRGDSIPAPKFEKRSTFEETIAYLEGQKISSKSFDLLSKNDKLKGLVLSGSRFVNQDLAKIGNLSTLEEIDLTASNADDLTVSYLAEYFKNIRILKLNHTAITDAAAIHLQNMPNLKRLDLSDTKIGDTALKILEGHPSLTELNLSRTNVGQEGLFSLRSMPSLDFSSVELFGLKKDPAGRLPSRNPVEAEKLLLQIMKQDPASLPIFSAEQLEAALPILKEFDVTPPELNGIRLRLGSVYSPGQFFDHTLKVTPGSSVELNPLNHDALEVICYALSRKLNNIERFSTSLSQGRESCLSHLPDGLRALTIVDSDFPLYRSPFTFELAEQLARFKNLEELNLVARYRPTQYNRNAASMLGMGTKELSGIDKSIVAMLPSLTKLKSLQLSSGTRLGGDFIEAIAKVPNLRTLRIQDYSKVVSSEGLSGLPDSDLIAALTALAKHKSLKSLELAGLRFNLELPKDILLDIFHPSRISKKSTDAFYIDLSAREK